MHPLFFSSFSSFSLFLILLLSYLDSRITNFSFDHFTGTIYLVDPRKIRENLRQKSLSMITSSGTNPVDHQYISNHHVSLITQPVLAGRSRSKKNQIQQISSMDKDPPQFILPVHRVKNKRSMLTIVLFLFFFRRICRPIQRKVLFLLVIRTHPIQVLIFHYQRIPQFNILRHI